ncbi:MAG: hypothetical protein FWG11_08645, partial [Promicromonosporaceae bacterium]|nr:hypothetical protein [Promicromonosporaceae bacterium]
GDDPPPPRGGAPSPPGAPAVAGGGGPRAAPPPAAAAGQGGEPSAVSSPLAEAEDVVGTVLAGLRLSPGESVTCHGILVMDLEHADTADYALLHRNELTITARGAHTGRIVTGEDHWQVTAVAAFEPPVLDLPPTGGDNVNHWAWWGGLAVLGAATLGALFKSRSLWAQEGGRADRTRIR